MGVCRTTFTRLIRDNGRRADGFVLTSGCVASIISLLFHPISFLVASAGRGLELCAGQRYGHCVFTSSNIVAFQVKTSRHVYSDTVSGQ